MGRPKKNAEVQADQTEVKEVDTEVEVAPVEAKKVPEAELVEKRGKFSLFKAGDEFVVFNDNKQAVGRPKTEAEGRALLTGWNRA
jgi:hypothetical protein